MLDKGACHWKVFKLPAGTLTAEFLFYAAHLHGRSAQRRRWTRQPRDGVKVLSSLVILNLDQKTGEQT